MLRLLLLGAVAAAATLEGAGEGGVQVTLSGGVFKGETLEAGGERKVFSFRGIPFAKPPVGALRFKDPVPSEPWEVVRESFTPPQCPQVDFKNLMMTGERKMAGEEDCLYLHVYTPQLCGDEPLPVMVFLHGGAFFMGGPDFLGGSPLPLLTKDVVLVAPQYRLGTLGFLYTGDDVIPGNMGLKDQTLALRWVQENIRSFGGDPKRVTIYGQSAGGSSVHFQMLTPKAEGLFHRAIMQSGNALSCWALRLDDPKRVAAGVGRQVECTGVEVDGRLDSVALLNCLQKVPASDLMLANVQGETWNNFPLHMAPRVDGDYLPDHPANLMREGRYNKVDVISGMCRDEGANFGLESLTTPEGERLLSEYPRFAAYSVGTDQDEEPYYLARRIHFHYLGAGNITLTQSNIDRWIEMIGDALSFPHNLASQFHARDTAYGHGIYLYQLDHRGQRSLLDMIKTTLDTKWVAHGDDLQYLSNDVFGAPPLERLDDQFLSEVMLRLWTTFAATGNPTPDLSLGFRWAPVTPTNLHYLSLTPTAKMRPDPRTENHAFLADLPTRVNKLLFPEKFAAPSVAPRGGEDARGRCHA
ncbi:juvenile hormone esterase-like isoform X3 [Eriocheir sinensis]|uniref:juvenile hormone esterase-like isoform X3 n=1 Tax=Eriocheir sinensis TaxID=95602 RepID=UPI0021CA2BB9|nr:juvenile hormone esterase-like isoform X3 [Eriocheir sinensis]